jgi:hypothetical protein
VTVAEPETAPTLAVITDVPALAAVTNPVPFTVATPGFADSQEAAVVKFAALLFS